MNYRLNGIHLPGAPYPLCVRQAQARVRSVTTHPRVVAHALDLSPLPVEPGPLEGDRHGIRTTLQQLLEQLWANRLFWKPHAIESDDPAAPVGDLDLPDLPSDADADERQGRNEIRNGLYEMLASQLGAGWFSWKNQPKGGGARVDGEPGEVHGSDTTQGDVLVKLPEDGGDDDDNKDNTPEDDAPPPNIWRFLKPVPVSEVRMARVMASLSDLTYFVAKVTPQSLFRRHNLNLVTTSLMFKDMFSKREEIEEVMALGDGMGAAEDFSHFNGEEVLVKKSNNIVTATSEDEPVVISGPQTVPSSTPRESEEPMWLGTKKIASRMAFTVGSAANGLYSQGMAQLARQLQHAMLFGQSAVNTTASQVINLVQAALTPGNPDPAESESDKTGRCPTEWFVCDHEETNTRIFCIQGSDNFESWQTNLSFDPVEFEDESLGVRVHRGVYEAAKGLYGLFAPLVTDHLKSSPNAKVSMTGHSLGGSLSMVLLLMLVHRGVLPPESVGRVYTYGAAASFCEAILCGRDCGSCGLSCPAHDSPMKRPQPSTSTLLEKLNLDPDCISNVVMHKDIVPRAFACDYSPVATWLRKVGPSFHVHCGLQRSRPLLYGFVGQVLVLQPDKGKSYVHEDDHPMLPKGAGLFEITGDTEGLDEVMGWKRSGPVGEGVVNHREAILSLMDNPHPLDILADSKAYGETGTISRYHNPMHYKNALGSVLNSCKHQKGDGEEETSLAGTSLHSESRGGLQNTGVNESESPAASS